MESRRRSSDGPPPEDPVAALQEGSWDNDEPSLLRTGPRAGLATEDPEAAALAAGPRADPLVLRSLGRHLELLAGLLQRQPHGGPAEAAGSALADSALALSRQLGRAAPRGGGWTAWPPEEGPPGAGGPHGGNGPRPVRRSAGDGDAAAVADAAALPDGDDAPLSPRSLPTSRLHRELSEASSPRNITPRGRTTSNISSDAGRSRPRSPPEDAAARKRNWWKLEKSKTLAAFGRGSSTAERLDEASTAFRTLRDIVSSTRFEFLFALLVAMNCFVMVALEEFEGIQNGARLGFYTHYGTEGYMKGWWPQFQQVMFVLECIFAVMFTMEVCLTFTYDLWTWKLDITSDFRDPFWTQPLEMLDAAVIWVSNVILLTNLSGPVSRLRFVRILRLLRMGRLVRAVRHFHFLDPLHLMATALKGSTGAMLFSAIIFFGILTMFAMVFSTLMRWEYLHDESTLPDETQAELFRYFGTYSRSMVSMLELAVANWPRICRFLSDDVHECFSVFCCVFKWVVGFAVIAVLNGIFIQEILSVAANDEFIMVRARMRQNVQQVKKITRLFKFADGDGDGMLTRKEMESVLSKPSIRAWLEAMELRFADAGMLFDMIANKGQGEISSEEFIQGIGRLKGPARNLDVVKVLDILTQSQQESMEQHKKSVKEEVFAIRRTSLNDSFFLDGPAPETVAMSAATTMAI